MNLSVSALAWTADEHEAALKLLCTAGLTHVELVPGRVQDVSAEKIRLKTSGLNAVAFQALLFGTKDLHLFQSNEQRDALAAHLKSVARLAAELEW